MEHTKRMVPAESNRDNVGSEVLPSEKSVDEHCAGDLVGDKPWAAPTHSDYHANVGLEEARPYASRLE